MTRYLFVAIANAILVFALFRSLYLRAGKPWQRAALVVAAFVLAVPALLFAGNYLLRLPNGIWFVNFHSVPGAEASSGLVGALLGLVFATRRGNRSIRALSTIAAMILLLTPFAKQLFFRLDYSEMSNIWNNGVCRQSRTTTCVPASCATVIRMLGGNVTEQELARDAGSNRRGTEIWYMRRALRKHGYEMEARDAKSSTDIQAPSVVGVKVGSGGHVVALMSKTDAGPEIGDPLGTHKRYTWAEFENRYHPNGVYLLIRPITSPDIKP
jgi:predicted double-glycine peptidase